MGLTEFAKVRLEQVAKAVENDPLIVAMSQFSFSKLDRINYHLQEPACGTVGCIAGWAVAMDLPKSTDLLKMSQTEISDMALKILDLGEAQENLLFYASYWPEPFKSQIEYAPVQTQEYADIVAARIRHFISVEGDEGNGPNLGYTAPVEPEEEEDYDWDVDSVY